MADGGAPASTALLPPEGHMTSYLPPFTEVFSDHGKSLLEQLQRQLQYGIFCDVIVRVEDYDFRLHKCVLAAASNKLQSMLVNARPECGNIITLRQVSFNAFRHIIDYMYTGKLKIEHSSVYEILSTAQYLEIKPIIKSCVEYLKTWNITKPPANIAREPMHVNEVAQLVAPNVRIPPVSNFISTRQLGMYGTASHNTYAPANSTPAPAGNVSSVVTVDTNLIEDYLKVIESFQNNPNAWYSPTSLPTIGESGNQQPDPPPVTMSSNASSVSQPTSNRSPGKIQPYSSSLDSHTYNLLTSALAKMSEQRVNEQEQRVNDVPVMAVEEEVRMTATPECAIPPERVSPPEHTAPPERSVPTERSAPHSIQTSHVLTPEVSRSLNEREKDAAEMLLTIKTETETPQARLYTETHHDSSESDHDSPDLVIALQEESPDGRETPDDTKVKAQKSKSSKRKRKRPTKLESIEAKTSYVGTVETGSEISASKTKKLKGERMTDKDIRHHQHFCEQCPRSFKREVDLQNHMLLHNTEKEVNSYSCHVCHKRFSRSAELTRHSRIHTGENYHCDDCNTDYDSQKLFRTHMRLVHYESKAFLCSFPGCNYRATKPSNLERHAVIHAGSKTYECKKCGNRFAQANGLRSHVQSCYEKRSYLCDICGASFNHLGSMKSHRFTHTGERPFVCTDCGAKFADHRNFKRHRRIHDNTYPYACTVCDRKFRHSNSLKTHLNAHQKDFEKRLLS